MEDDKNTESTIRDTLESTIVTLESGGPEGANITEGSATPAAGSPASVPPASPPPKDAGAPAAAAPVAGAPAAPGSAPISPAPKPGEPAAPGSAPADRPPGTWTPEAREHWKTVPQAVKEVIWKREKEVTRALTAATEARNFTAEFGRAVQPFMGFIAAEQSTPLKAFENLMQNAAILRVGTKEQKVALVADIINRYGVDLEALDSHLGGNIQQKNSPETMLREMLTQELAPIRQWFQGNQRQLQVLDQQLDQEVDQDLTTFAADPKHEFFEDVKDIMADIVEVAHRRGTNMGLTEAYERAIMLSEPVRRIIESRKTTNSAQEAQRIADQARRTASSVSGNAELSNVVAAPSDDIRSAIENSIRQHGG